MQKKIPDIINVQEYPIDEVNTVPYNDLVSRARESLQTKGYFALPNFICKSGLDLIKAQCQEVISTRNVLGNQVGRAVNCFYTEKCDDLPINHPQNTFFSRRFGVIRDDMIHEHDAIRSVYDSEHLLRFVAAVLGLKELHQSRDSYQALTVNVMSEGDNLHWHFDCNACAVTLGIQEPQGGGQFEFVPFIGRTSFDRIQDVLSPPAGTEPGTSEFCTQEGMLVFFCGGESLHRVKPVVGSGCRLVAALQYHTNRDAFDTPEMTERIYGVSVAEHVGPKESVVSTYEGQYGAPEEISLS